MTTELGGVGVVGPGRVGTVVATALRDRGERIQAVVGRGPASTQRFSARFPEAADEGHAGLRDCGLILVATPDDVVEVAVTEMAVADVLGPGQRVVHLSGRHGLAPLRRAELAGARIAACHPAQTIPTIETPPDDLVGAAWAVTAGIEDRAWAEGFVRRIGGVPFDIAEADRLLYHAGLAVGSNAVGAAVSVARRLLLAAGLREPGVFLERLVGTSVENVLASGADAITGPVRRGDVGTVEAHVEALRRDAPDLAELYLHLGSVILAQVGPELPLEDRLQLEAALAVVEPGEPA